MYFSWYYVLTYCTACEHLQPWLPPKQYWLTIAFIVIIITCTPVVHVLLLCSQRLANGTMYAAATVVAGSCYCASGSLRFGVGVTLPLQRLMHQQASVAPNSSNSTPDPTFVGVPDGCSLRHIQLVNSLAAGGCFGHPV
jgi:hypothetical protein